MSDRDPDEASRIKLPPAPALPNLLGRGSAPTAPREASKMRPGPSLPPGAAGSPHMSTASKLATVQNAISLRENAVRNAYAAAEKASPINRELNGMIEQVISELRRIESRDRTSVPHDQLDRTEREIGVIRDLRTCLEGLMSDRREGYLRRQLERIQRRISAVYFESELRSGAPIDTAQRVMGSTEQAVYYAMRTHEGAIAQTLRSMGYHPPADAGEAVRFLENQTRQLSLAFLARTAPELERLLAAFVEEIARFLLREFRPALGDFAWEVVRETQMVTKMHGARLSTESFASFRQVFDRKFLERLVQSVQDPLLTKLVGRVDERALRLAADPKIYAEICGVLCNSMLDYLHAEGLIELPESWRSHIAHA